MSTEKAHISQYDHNFRFSKSIDSNEYPDWFVTVTFYCGIHLVEAMLAKKADKHTKDGGHSQRQIYIKEYLNSGIFFKEYRSLQRLSRIARYECTTILPKDSYGAQSDLEAILAAYKAS